MTPLEMLRHHVSGAIARGEGHAIVEVKHTFKFEIGKTYHTRSICDADLIIKATIAKRTNKTVSAMVRGELKTFRVSEYMGVEQFKPWGSYSMAPTLSADKVMA